MLVFFKKNYLILGLVIIISLMISKIGIINESLSTHQLVYRFVNAIRSGMYATIYYAGFVLIIRMFKGNTETAALKMDNPLKREAKLSKVISITDFSKKK